MSKSLDMKKRVKKTTQQEESQAIKLNHQMENLSELAKRLEDMREEAALKARHKDIDYVEKLDDFISTVLDTLIGNRKTLEKSIVKMLEKGEIKKLKELMVALGISVDKRENLLGYDETRRGADKRKLRLRVVWKGTDGSQGGVDVEQ